MGKHVRTSGSCRARLVFAQVCACAVLVPAACTSVDGDSTSPEAEPASSADAPTADPRVDPVSAAAQDSGLVRKKRELLLQSAIENARAAREHGDYVQARNELERALQIDPASAELTVMYLEVLELLGERPGETLTAKETMEQRFRAWKDSRRMEAEEYHRQAIAARERGDYDGAIRFHERVRDSIRWASVDIDWGDLEQQNQKDLDQARADKLTAGQARDASMVEEAVARIEKEESRQKADAQVRIATILEKANMKFERGDFDAAIDLSEEALVVDPTHRVAQEMKDVAIAARRAGRAESYVEQRKEAYRKLKREIDELRVPYSEELTPASDEYWSKVSQRSAESLLGLEDVVDPVDRELEQRVMTTRIPEVNFQDDELKTVLEYLRGVTGVPIFVTPEVQSAIETAATLITMPHLSNVTLHTVLEILASNLGGEYDWTIRNGVVMFTTLQDAYGTTVIRTHPIQDLTFDRVDFKGPQIDRISLPNQYGEDEETSVFASDLDREVIINPEDILNLIKSNVARETWELGEKFQIDVAASNQILVIHTPKVQAEVHAFLNDLRRFSSTVVYVESRFIEVTDAFIQEIGVDFRGLDDVVLDDTSVGPEDNSSQGRDNFGSGASTTAAASAGIFFNDNSDGDIRARTENFFEDPLGNLLTTTGGGAFQFSILDDTQFNFVVNMVEKSADATTIMAPILTVFNTERAYVTVINEVSFLQDFDVDVANTAFIANPEIGVIQEGVVLDVRPTVSYDRQYVTLEVRTSVAELERPIETFETTLAGFTDPVTFQIPRLTVQNANTTVVVPDGGSVILGGLKTITHVNRRAEIPWVSRIPLLGILFREKGVNDESQSLVILVRAKISDLAAYRESNVVRQ